MSALNFLGRTVRGGLQYLGDGAEWVDQTGAPALASGVGSGLDWIDQVGLPAVGTGVADGLEWADENAVPWGKQAIADGAEWVAGGLSGLFGIDFSKPGSSSLPDQSIVNAPSPSPPKPAPKVNDEIQNTTPKDPATGSSGGANNMAIDPVSAVGAGASLLGGIVGAFGGVDQKRIVDPYVKQAVEFQDQALDYARNTRDSQISAAYQFGDQASNQTQQMIGGQMMNKTGRSDGAFVGGMGNAMRALSRNNALGAVGQAHQAYQGQINQTAQGRLNAAAQVMYQAEPDFLTKLGAGLTGVTQNVAEGAGNARIAKDLMPNHSAGGQG